MVSPTRALFCNCAAKNKRIAELEVFKTDALVRLHRLAMALTRIEYETPDSWIRNIAHGALYPKPDPKPD